MRRTVSVLITLVLLLTSCGCTQKAENFEQPATFYYAWSNAEDSIFAAEIREVKPFADDLLTLTNHYFAGPVTDEYVNVFPADLEVLSLEIQNNMLILTVSDELSLLNSLELSIACACIGMTLLEMTECSELEIKAESKPLDGKKSILLTLDDLYLLDVTLTVN